jgi:two-component system response regulator RegX3
VRIALLEDDAALFALTSAWLKNEGHDVHGFSLTRDLIRFASRESVDLYILDWMLPDQTGGSFLTWLRQTREDNTPALFLTALDSEDDIVAGLNAGADDFIIKPVSQRVLLSRIAAIMRRSRPEAASLIELPPYRIDAGRKQICLRDEPLELTEKEFDLALFLFRNIGRLLSRGHMLQAVWSVSPDLVTRTVDTHISRVRAKLQLKPENGFRLTPTYNYGYRLEQLETAEG